MAVWGMGVMVGPILGPTLGGWLTDSYNWRWVFFINVPIGAFALFGVLSFLPNRAPARAVKFDAFGFITLGLAIGAFQAMLDRGEQLDWFGSLEIRIEAILAGSASCISWRTPPRPGPGHSSGTSCSRTATLPPAPALSS